MVRITYRSAYQNNFFEILNKIFLLMQVPKKHIVLLILTKVCTKLINILFMKITQFARNLHVTMLKSVMFCTMLSLKQLIQCPTRVTCSTLTVIDHIRKFCWKSFSKRSH